MRLLRIAAIDFLNPAPLMWDFEHAPRQKELARRYAIEKVTPARCSAQLAAGHAELGLIPIADYAQLGGLAVVPGCAIASLGSIRSILLVLRATEELPFPGLSAVNDPDLFMPRMQDALASIRSVALDTASRSSAMYTRILCRKYWAIEPDFLPQPADLEQMLASADAALLIGDPALFALEDRAARLARTGERLLYLDLGSAWHAHTGLPWVSAFWAARLAGLCPGDGMQIITDLNASREVGLASIPALAVEWSTKLKLPEATIAQYLGKNIHYRLDEPCLKGIERFYADATECALMQRQPHMYFLNSDT